MSIKGAGDSRWDTLICEVGVFNWCQRWMEKTNSTAVEKTASTLVNKTCTISFTFYGEHGLSLESCRPYPSSPAPDARPLFSHSSPSAHFHRLSNGYGVFITDSRREKKGK